MNLKYYFLFLFKANLILAFFNEEKNVKIEIPLSSEGELREIKGMKNNEIKLPMFSEGEQRKINGMKNNEDKITLYSEGEQRKIKRKKNKRSSNIDIKRDNASWGNLSHSITSEHECLSETLSNNYFMKGFLKKICLNEDYTPYYSKKYLTRMYQPSYEYYNRKLFYYLLEKKGFKEAFSQIFNFDKNVAIFNFYYGLNYGAALTGYALQTVLLDLGYNPYSIGKFKGKKNVFTNFVNENMFYKGLKGFYNRNLEKFRPLNKYYNNFVVGSDQIWRYKYIKILYKIFYFAFVEENKNKIAMAASFGINGWEGPDYVTDQVRKYIKSFNKISVREKGGVDVCRNIFNVNATAVFDPVFYLKRNDWNKLLDRSTVDMSNSNFVYLIDRSKQLVDKINALFKRVDPMNPFPHWVRKGEINVYDYLKTIQTSRRIVTDSFHGICFSIIFHKDFVCVCNKSRGEERFKSILSDLGIKGRLFDDVSKVDWETIPPIDYSLVEKRIEEKRKEGIEFLASSLRGSNEF